MVWSKEIPQPVRKEARKILEERLESTHQNFLSTMNPLLGINLIPENKIEINPHTRSGGYVTIEDPKRIVIGTSYWQDASGFDCNTCFDRWVKTKEMILGHEVGHIYHSKLNPEQFSKNTIKERETEGDNWLLGEVIAELTMLTYFKNKGQLNNILEYTLGYTYKRETKIGLISHMLIRDNSQNLEPLLNYLHRSNLSEGLKILDPYREKSKKTIVVADHDLYFGFCDHKFPGNRLYRQLTLF